MTTNVLAIVLWCLRAPSAEPAADAPEAAAEGAPETDREAHPSPARELLFEPGVMVWLRGQARHAPRYTTTLPPAVDLLSRIRLQALLKWRGWSAFAQAQDHRAFGARGESVTGAVGFQQGWMKLEGKTKHGLSGFIRAGRQEIAWGRHRLIGTWPWAPQGRSFDAVQLQGRVKFVGLELMYAMMERPRTFAVPDDVAGELDVHTGGVHLGGARLFVTPHRAVGLELMGLVDWADVSPSQIDRRRRLGDVGGRVWGDPFAWLWYDLEAHGQFGEVGRLDHNAWAFASTVRARAPLEPVSPGVQLGYTIASGHACTGAQGSGCAPVTSKDFFNFYPTNHPHYGILDQLGWSNMRDAEAGVFVQHEAGFEASAVYHYFQLHEQRGAWRDSGGNLVGQGWDPGGADPSLGHELDLLVTAELWGPLWLQPGYGVFMPTSAATRLAGSEPQHFVFLWVIVEMPKKPQAG
jgi:hypothetical protein